MTKLTTDQEKTVRDHCLNAIDAMTETMRRMDGGQIGQAREYAELANDAAEAAHEALGAACRGQFARMFVGAAHERLVRSLEADVPLTECQHAAAAAVAARQAERGQLCPTT